MTTKGINIYVMRILGKEEKEKGTGEILEAIMTEILLGLMSDTKPQLQAFQSTQSSINVKKSTPAKII